MAGKLKALLLWCQKNANGYRDVNVVNMTTSWKDGLAFCALIHHFRPDLIDFNSLSKENIFHNNQLAFQTAEKELGIAALLDADDMVSMKVPDKLSIITYVSQYYNCLHKMEPVFQDADAEIQSVKCNAPFNFESSEIKKSVLDEKNNKIKKSLSVLEQNQTFSQCEICKKKVHLVERFIEEGKIYHRLCFRSKSLSRMYRRTSPQHNYSETTASIISSTPNYCEPQNCNSLNNPVNASTSSSKRISRVLAMANAFDNNAKQEGKSSENKPLIEVACENLGQSNHTNLTQENDSLESDDYLKCKEASVDYKTPDSCLNMSSNQIIGNSLTFNETLIPDDSTKFKAKTNVALSSNEVVPGDQTSTDTNLKHRSDSSSDDMLPALSLSLSQTVRLQETSFVQHSPHKDNESTPTIEISPLICELPLAPAAKPRSQTTSTRTSILLEPSAKQRISKSSSNSTSSLPDSHLNNCLSSENTEPENMNKVGKTEYDQLLNPFEDDNSTEVQSARPFDGSENSKLKPTSSEERLRSGTVNIINERDIRLNPFTDEYEEKKYPVVPPVSSYRNKVAASTSINRNETPPCEASSKHTRRDAPAWKETVEEKTNEMNHHEANDRFIKKTRSTINIEENSPVKAPRKSKIKSNTKSNRPAPGFGFPLVKRKVKNQMTEDEISSEMTILDIQLKELEKKGVKLEELLREELEVDLDEKTDSDKLLGEWFDLVQEKNKLVRRETDLVYLMQQQRLEQEHADVEFKIRKLMNKPDKEKTEADKEEESKLLDQLMSIVERRNTIINSIEEARVKEEEEDTAYYQVKSMRGTSPGDARTSKKKKPKIKRIFSRKKKSSKSAPSNSQSAPR